MNRLDDLFERKRGYGLIFLRLVAGWRLIAGVWEYAIQSNSISEVAAFFTQLHIPLPLISAYVSVYAQLICGALFILGIWVRAAALLMIINFIVAIIAAHLTDPIVKSFSAWALLAISISLLFEGGGRLSVGGKGKSPA